MHWGKNSFDRNSLVVDETRLGMEARSIYKSIKTEEAKLIQYANPTRSDLHYFRARFNYYRLSLLRLSSEEKTVLEPVLSRFLDRIVRIEGGEEVSPPPFLEAVEPHAGSALEGKTLEQGREARTELEAEHFAPTPRRTLEESKPSDADSNFSSAPAMGVSVKDQLKLIQMALRADATDDGNALISKSLQAVIDRLED